MPKRKREDGEGTSDPELATNNVDRSTKIRASRLKAKTPQHVKELHSALKLARGFERQKLGRRQKTATKKKDQKALDRLKEEVLALKSLELYKLAEKHMLKQYVRTKRIREHAAFKAAYGEDPKIEPPRSPAEANVLARLFSSNPVKEAMTKIIPSVLQTLGLEDLSAFKPSDEAPVESKKERTASVREGETVNGIPSDEESEFEGFSDGDQPAVTAEEVSYDSDGGSEPDLNELDGMDLDRFNDRLASDSNSDSEDDAFIPDIDASKTNEYAESTAYSKSRDLSLSPSPSISLSPSREPEKKSKTKAAPSASKPTTSTTFLPSLMMGGYFSGSESEGSVDDALPQVRKNRRGQRARQKINERKYGKGAKHLVKAKEEGKEIRWDPKRGAVIEEPSKGKKGFAKGKRGKDETNPSTAGRKGRPMGRGPQSSGANSGALGKDRKFNAGGAGTLAGKPNSKPTDQGPLHPSWEAAKKRKEQKMAGNFEGKKITFD